MKDNWPNFFIIGAARAGTTSLYSYLSQHPQIYMSPLKEPHFFSNIRPAENRQHLFTWVSDQEEYLRLFQNATNYPAVGEASTSYLWSDQAPERIFNQIPDARMIVLLRDPIERAFSHYLLDVRDGRQRLPFYEALISDYENSIKGWFVSNLYVELGFYHQQISRYFHYFDPTRILIVFFDDLITDTTNILKQIAQFLEIDDHPLSSNKIDAAHNPYAKARSRVAQELILLSRNKYLQAPYQLYKKMAPQTIKDLIRLRILRNKDEKPEIDVRAVEFLRQKYTPEIDNLEILLNLDLQVLRRSWNISEI